MRRCGSAAGQSSSAHCSVGHLSGEGAPVSPSRRTTRSRPSLEPSRRVANFIAVGTLSDGVAPEKVGVRVRNKRQVNGFFVRHSCRGLEGSRTRRCRVGDGLPLRLRSAARIFRQRQSRCRDNDAAGWDRYLRRRRVRRRWRLLRRRSVPARGRFGECAAVRRGDAVPTRLQRRTLLSGRCALRRGDVVRSSVRRISRVPSGCRVRQRRLYGHVQRDRGVRERGQRDRHLHGAVLRRSDVRHDIKRLHGGL